MHNTGVGAITVVVLASAGAGLVQPAELILCGQYLLQ